MLAKRTVKNQITLPQKVVSLFPDIEYFDVTTEKGKIILMPIQMDRLEKLREKMSQLKISDKTIDGAVKWARKQKI